MLADMAGGSVNPVPVGAPTNYVSVDLNEETRAAAAAVEERYES